MRARLGGLAGRRHPAARGRLHGETLRVAALTVAIVAGLYVVAVGVVDVLVAHNLTADVDRRLSERLAELEQRPPALLDLGGIRQVRDADDRSYEAPVLAWMVGPAGDVVDSTPGAPALPAELRHAQSPRGADLSGTDFRLAGAAAGRNWLVIAESAATVGRGVTSLVVAEALVGPPLLAAVFLGALLVGRRVAAPIEEARRRQLAFTADASHELRTPVAVIEAETSLTLSRERDAAAYRQAIERIAAEGGRLRRVVDDLLWLARFDAEPRPPDAGPVDLATAVEDAAERFARVAVRRGVTVTAAVEPGPRPVVHAPAEWIDRLTGVLLDNACRHARQDGRVRVSAAVRDSRAVLLVEDDGPGIPPEERQRVFDRFHTSGDGGAGAGLGLAIGDAVVRATGGRWAVEDSPLGGAAMAVSWPRAAGG